MIHSDGNNLYMFFFSDVVSNCIEDFKTTFPNRIYLQEYCVLTVGQYIIELKNLSKFKIVMKSGSNHFL